MHPPDPRSDPAVADLVELVGIWVGIPDWPGALRALERLRTLAATRFPQAADYHDLLAGLEDDLRLAAAGVLSAEEGRRRYRKAMRG